MIKKIIFNILLFLSCNCFAATSAQELINKLNHIKTMQADFRQTSYDNYKKPIQSSSGKILLERPGKFRWQILKPIPQTIIANNGKLWIIDSDLEQVTIKHLKEDSSDAPALLLSHPDKTLERTYVVSKFDMRDNPLNWFLLDSKREDSMFASIQLGFKADQIIEMRLKDHLGHETHVEFSQIKNNIHLQEANFKFKSNADFDVIDETK